jgi:predicted tellurium resistance membrane protein TerC
VNFLGDILKIYFINIINDLDNILIISAVIRKYGYQIKSLFFYIVLCLTISRTIYVMIIQYLAEIPGLRVIIGFILLCIAIRLACSIQEDKEARSISRISITKIMLIVLATDFSVCLDSVMVTSGLSTNLFFIMVGIFLSVSTVFYVLDYFSEIMAKTSLVQIIAGGLIAHIAILDMLKDPITETPILYIEDFFQINIHHWYNMFALDIAILVIFIGLMKRINSRI